MGESDETDFHDVAGANVGPRRENFFTIRALADVADERARQDRKWGEQNHDVLYWYAVLGEEYGEVGEAALAYVDWDRTLTQGAVRADEDHYRTELIHVAAVAVAAIETLDRARGKRAEIIKRMPPREADAWRSINAHADELARQQREAGA